MDLTDIKTIKALLARHGFHFSKSMEQQSSRTWTLKNIM